MAEEIKDPTAYITVMADYVLVKQVMKKKFKHIITDAAINENDKFNITFEIVQKGDECKRKFKIGDFPIFSSYVQFSSVKVIEKNDEGMIALIVVHENDIIATDNEPPKIITDEHDSSQN